MNKKIKTDDLQMPEVLRELNPEDRENWLWAVYGRQEVVDKKKKDWAMMTEEEME